MVDEFPGQRPALCAGDERGHQLLLLALTVSVFLIEVVPVELQRRIVDNSGRAVVSKISGAPI